MLIGKLMTWDPVAVGPETPLKDVAAILLEHHISGVPVIGERLEVLGVVSEADIVAKEVGADPRGRKLIDRLLGARSVDPNKAAARTASAAMTSPAITIGAGETVWEAARRMTDYGIKRLPVVNENAELIGIVTRADLVRAFARPDDEIESEIRDTILRMLWIDEPGLYVHVKRGEVRLAGKVQRRSDAELIRRFAGRVPGVADVHSTLRWAWDDTRTGHEQAQRVRAGSAAAV